MGWTELSLIILVAFFKIEERAIVEFDLLMVWCIASIKPCFCFKLMCNQLNGKRGSKSPLK